MIDYSKYEAVIGLEVHIQLLTASKAYSNDAADYGAMPNTLVGVVSLGHPGTLPKVNKKVVEFAVKLGLAVDAQIRERNAYARKNYFYADLPKGYQITQDTTPICTGGKITIKLEDGSEKDIQITRIHMEEDAGKSIHDIDPFHTLVDLNRAGVPLLEMVSEPDIRSSEEAYKYLTEVRKLVRYLDICDGNMEEGSMRCDANVSVRIKGDKQFGRKVEVKNMNSIRNVQRAIEFEIRRQIEVLESGGEISQDTRSFDSSNGTTFLLRSKEMANDYRYFPEPDLPPVIVSKEFIQGIKINLPELPHVLIKRYQQELGLGEYDATNLTESRAFASYFNLLIKDCSNYKGAANWMLGPVKSYLNENGLSISQFSLSPGRLAALIHLVDQGKVSHTVAAQQLFPKLLTDTSLTPLHIAESLNLLQDSSTENLMEFVKSAVAKYPEKVEEYKNGKVGLIGLFMGEVMKMSKGKADPKVANSMMKDYLDSI